MTDLIGQFQRRVKFYAGFFFHRIGTSCFRLNSVSDQRNLGMSMKIERSSVDQVKARFALNKKKVEEKKKDYDLEQRVAELREEVRLHQLRSESD